MFVHSAQLRCSDVGSAGAVAPGRFLDYLDDALEALLASPDNRVLEPGCAVVARTEIDFIRPVTRSSGPVNVALRVSHVGRSSFGVISRFDQGGEVAARATSVLVCYDRGRRRPRSLTPAERADLGRWQRSPDE